MGSTLTNLLYHVVFSTKNRENLITITLEDRLYGYIGGIIRWEKGKLLKIGGTENHIHIFAKFSHTSTVSHMLQMIKGNSSKWINQNKLLCLPFHWQRGYSAFSVSESMANIVSNYIANQKEHHKKLTFKEELLSLLKKHNIPYDEKYLWD